MREKKGQQAQLDGLLTNKQQLLAEELPKVCYSIGSLQCLDIIKASTTKLALAKGLQIHEALICSMPRTDPFARDHQ